MPQQPDPGPIDVHVLRVFTRDGEGGNHLGVVDGVLTDGDMARVARQMGFAETIFVDPPDDSGVRPVRIFTPSAELPFAGHPLVGAAWHVAHHHVAGGVDEAPIRFRCGIGIVSGHGHGDVAEVVAPGGQTVRAVDPPAGVVAAWIVEMPLPYELHLLADATVVRAYELPDRPAFRLVWAPDGDQPGAVRARFFVTSTQIDEDPATGSAAVALAAVLRAGGEAEGTRIVFQGDETGHPSTIHLAWDADSATIGGTVEAEPSAQVPI